MIETLERNVSGSRFWCAVVFFLSKMPKLPLASKYQSCAPSEHETAMGLCVVTKLCDSDFKSEEISWRRRYGSKPRSSSSIVVIRALLFFAAEICRAVIRHVPAPQLVSGRLILPFLASSPINEPIEIPWPPVTPKSNPDGKCSISKVLSNCLRACLASSFNESFNGIWEMVCPIFDLRLLSAIRRSNAEP